MTFQEIFKAALIVFGLALIPTFYQSCSGGTPQMKDRGVKGGSLTIVYSKYIHDYNYGRVDSYIEQYDDKNNSLAIDLMTLDAPMLRIQDIVPFNQNFVLLMVNGHLSDGVILQLNEEYYFLKDYHQRSLDYIYGNQKALPVFNRQTLLKARLIFLDDVIEKSKVLATRIDCVAANRPGQKGEHRDGALTIQVLDYTSLAFDAFTRGAAQKALVYGEYSVFAHHKHGLCY